MSAVPELQLGWKDFRELARVDVPEGEYGAWRIRRITVSEKDSDFDRLRAVIGGHGRFTPAGTYTQLLQRGAIVMSDTPDEIRDHAELFFQARGQVLVHGLGIGCLIGPVLAKPEVEHLTVVELDPGVLKLVAPHYRKRYPRKRLTILQGDSFTWQPPKGVRYGAVWHDIWPTICTDNLEAMGKLHRRFGRRADWQGSWSKELCLYQRCQDRARGW